MRVKRRRRALEAAAAVLLALPFLLPLLVLLSHSFLSGWELRQLLAEVGSFAEERFLPLRVPPPRGLLRPPTGPPHRRRPPIPPLPATWPSRTS